jgi:hypothetical protein
MAIDTMSSVRSKERAIALSQEYVFKQSLRSLVETPLQLHIILMQDRLTFEYLIEQRLNACPPWYAGSTPAIIDGLAPDGHAVRLFRVSIGITATVHLLTAAGVPAFSYHRRLTSSFPDASPVSAPVKRSRPGIRKCDLAALRTTGKSVGLLCEASRRAYKEWQEDETGNP